MSRHRHINVARMAGPGDWWTPPDDDGLHECDECGGTGQVVTDCDDGGRAYREPCECCAGAGYFDENGQPAEAQS